MTLAKADPKGLIRESYAIEGISYGECRSIFLDWALSLPVGAVMREPVTLLISHYGDALPDHPMSKVLSEALIPAAPPRRKGGRAARVPG